MAGGEEGVCEAGGGGDGGVKRDDGAVGETGAFAEGGWCCGSVRGGVHDTGVGRDVQAARVVVARKVMARKARKGEVVTIVLIDLLVLFCNLGLCCSYGICCCGSSCCLEVGDIDMVGWLQYG